MAMRIRRKYKRNSSESFSFCFYQDGHSSGLWSKRHCVSISFMTGEFLLYNFFSFPLTIFFFWCGKRFVAFMVLRHTIAWLLGFAQQFFSFIPSSYSLFIIYFVPSLYFLLSLPFVLSFLLLFPFSFFLFLPKS